MSKRMSGGALVLAITSLAGAIASAAQPAKPDARDDAPPMRSVLGLAFAPDGRSLASVGETSKNLWNVPGTLRVWDVDARRERFVVHTPALLWDVAYSPDGKTIAAGSVDGTARLLDAATGRERAVLEGHNSWVNHLDFSPDGKTIATGSGDSTIKLWDVAGGKLLETIDPEVGQVYTIDYSPDGKRLVHGGERGILQLWDVAGKHAVWAVPAHLAELEAVAFSPDGKIVASSSRDMTVKLWDAATGDGLATLRGHSVQVLRLAFSPGGTVLASASGRWGDYNFAPGPGETKLWDVAKRSEIATFEGHTDRTFAVAFAPDGFRLATGSWDRTIKVWDIRLRRELATLPPKPAEE